jgi:HPt (histidine-containing phosphotransfer) domain-containing protein
MSEFDDRYQALRRRFVERCREDLAVLEAAVAGTVATEVLRATVHRLSGAAGTFGYPELSRLVGVVDDALIEHGRADAAQLATLVDAVRVLTVA